MSLVTPQYSIPYLTPGDRMANIPAVDKAQALRIESLLETANIPPGNPDLNNVLARLNQLEAANLDTGWVDCPLIQPDGSQQGASLPQVRRKGNFVQMRWGVAGKTLGGTSFAPNSSYKVARIPEGFRPTEYKYFPIATAAARATALANIQHTDGSIDIRTGEQTSSYYIFDSCSWYIN